MRICLLKRYSGRPGCCLCWSQYSATMYDVACCISDNFWPKGSASTVDPYEVASMTSISRWSVATCWLKQTSQKMDLNTRLHCSSGSANWDTSAYVLSQLEPVKTCNSLGFGSETSGILWLECISAIGCFSKTILKPSDSDSARSSGVYVRDNN